MPSINCFVSFSEKFRSFNAFRSNFRMIEKKIGIREILRNYCKNRKSARTTTNEIYDMEKGDQ